MVHTYSILAVLLIPIFALPSIPPHSPQKLDMDCNSCHLVMSILKEYLTSDKASAQSKEILTSICKLFSVQEVCEGMLDLYSSLITSAFADVYLDADYMCFKYSFCDEPVYHTENFTEWQDEVLKDMPQPNPWPVPNHHSFRMLHITDIHIDPLYAIGSDLDCDEPMCCRNSNNSTTGAGYWGSKARCDIPPRTVELFMEQVRDMNISLVLWTGDSPPHDIWRYTQDNHTSYAEIITGMFKKYLPNVPIFPVLGNHGCFPMDEFLPGKEEWILNKYASFWKDFLDEEALKSFLINGYYSTILSNTSLRLIGLNTQLGDILNFKTWGNVTDPGGMLEWLRTELQRAEEYDEKVFIFGHIAAGDHFTSSIWSMHYRVLVNRYRNIIMGQFFGHTHFDHFQLIKSLSNPDEYAGVINMSPSLTTFPRLNPSFRIYEIDTQSYQPVNYYTYRLPLSQANADLSTTPKFELAYSAKELYNMKDLSPESYFKLVSHMKEDSDLLNTYYLNYYSSYPNEIQNCTSACQSELTCGALHSVFDEFANCTDELNPEEYIFTLLAKVMKEWVIKDTV